VWDMDVIEMLQKFAWIRYMPFPFCLQKKTIPSIKGLEQNILIQILLCVDGVEILHKSICTMELFFEVCIHKGL
jgi:hypothetical protein